MTTSEYTLQFSSITSDINSFRLLELPEELVEGIEGSGKAALNLVVKGGPTDEAVLCTHDKTYSIRALSLSNSLLVVTPLTRDGDGTSSTFEKYPEDLVVRQQSSQIMEVVPTIPKLHRLDRMLKDSIYDDAVEGDREDGSKPIKRRKISYDEVLDEIQASDGELQSVLKTRHILHLGGELRPITSAYLAEILVLLLNTLVSLSICNHSVRYQPVLDDMMRLHDVRPDVTLQIMKWYGAVDEHQAIWKMDSSDVVKGIGLDILHHHRHTAIQQREFVEKWRSRVGNAYEDYVDVSLLKGNYLGKDSTQGISEITYFPITSLPTDPAARFVDLFLTRARWQHADITPFLTDIAADANERDRLLLRYARVTSEDGVNWYTAKTVHL